MEQTQPVKKKKKKRTGIAAYFVPFGLRQTADLLMVVGAILIIVGLIVHTFLQEPVTVIVGLSMYVVACLISIYRCIKVFLNKELSKKSVERKNAIINVSIMGVILALAIVGIVAAVLNW